MTPEEWEGNPYHTHMVTRSRDCDGRYDTEYIYRRLKEGTESEIQREWDSKYELFDLLTLEVVMIPDVDKVEVEIRESDRGGWSFWAGQDTEEGFRTVMAQMCQDPDCDLSEGARFRDHTAESMGY